MPLSPPPQPGVQRCCHATSRLLGQLPTASDHMKIEMLQQNKTAPKPRPKNLHSKGPYIGFCLLHPTCEGWSCQQSITAQHLQTELLPAPLMTCWPLWDNFGGDRKDPAPTTLLLHPRYQTRGRSCSLTPSPRVGAHRSHLHPLARPGKSCSKTRAPQTSCTLQGTPAPASGLPWAESASLPSQGEAPSTSSLNGSSLMPGSGASFGQQLPPAQGPVAASRHAPVSACSLAFGEPRGPPLPAGLGSGVCKECLREANSSSRPEARAA